MDVVYQAPSAKFLLYAGGIVSWVDDIQNASVMSPNRLFEDKVLRLYVTEAKAKPVQVRVIRRVEIL